MPETLTARRALGLQAGEPLRSFGLAASVRLTELPLEAAFELQFDADDAATVAVLSKATGFVLTTVNRVVNADGMTAVWLGPGDWLITPGNDPAAPARLEVAVTAASCSLVDVSDLWFGVAVEGPHAGDLLAKGCALDLDAQAFAPGATAVAQLARLRALIHRGDGSPTFHLHVERSYAAYLWAWLVDATTEFL
jgi:sarcosine oxidase subunit gamma